MNLNQLFECNGVLSPCKDCKERCLGCHDSCEKYKAYLESRKEIRDARELKANSYFSNYESFMRKKMKDQKRGRK